VEKEIRDLMKQKQQLAEQTAKLEVEIESKRFGLRRLLEHDCIH